MSHHGLLFKICNLCIIVHLHDAVAIHIIAIRNFSTDYGDIRPFLNVEIQNIIKVHLVDTVAIGNDNIRLMTSLKEVDILPHCISSSSVPPAIISSDRRCKEEESALLTTEVPPLGGVQMLIQGTSIVLR